MINCAVLHPNEVEIIFGDQNGEIKVWDLQINKARQFWQLDLPSISITALEIAKDCTKLIAGNSAGFFYFWESEGAQAISTNNSTEPSSISAGGSAGQ